jgi:hypothetical protein
MTLQPSVLVAIHQPNFFPWLGFFDKIRRADRFILMDNAQFQKTGGTWSNRVNLLINGQAAWATMPVVRAFSGVRAIQDIQIDSTLPWRKKFAKTLNQSYGRAPFYNEVLPVLEGLIENSGDSLASFNHTAICDLAERLGISTQKIVLGSSLSCEGQATDLLINMTLAVGGTAYLCGGGAADYQEDEKFAASGLTLIYQQFKHPTYPQVQSKTFVPGLSTIDALMNCGFQGVRKLLSGEKGHDDSAFDMPEASRMKP